MIPFRNLLRLFIGDFLAKALYFLTFVYLARVLGVASYGVLEFALAVFSYFLLLADGGLELWATREAARGKDPHTLIARVVPLRILLALVAFLLLLMLLPQFPDYPGLHTILILMGLVLLAQAVNVKWVFIGQERMARVAGGLVIAQVVFAVTAFAFVRTPETVVWVPLLRLAGDLAMAAYFGWLYATIHGGRWPEFTLRGTGDILRPALTMGASHGLAFMSYNFDSVLLGFMSGSDSVGWYGAAYKPVTVVLAMPVTYFLGLFPTLSRIYAENEEAFRRTVARSLQLTSIFSLPIGIGGTFLARPIIDTLFGSAYANSVLPLQILSWSAALVILRGTFRQALNAAGRQDLDLRCASASIFLNVSLNLVLIPRYGVVGAAVTTVVTEVLWLTLASTCFNQRVSRVNVFTFLWQPAIAASAMAAYFMLAPPAFWIVRALMAGVVYFGTLLLIGEREVRSWVRFLLARVS